MKIMYTEYTERPDIIQRASRRAFKRLVVYPLVFFAAFIGLLAAGGFVGVLARSFNQ